MRTRIDRPTGPPSSPDPNATASTIGVIAPVSFDSAARNAAATPSTVHARPPPCALRLANARIASSAKKVAIRFTRLASQSTLSGWAGEIANSSAASSAASRDLVSDQAMPPSSSELPQCSARSNR